MTTPVVVIGGGRLGAAVARRAASEGRGVVVASRNPRPHAGLWRRWDAEHPDSLPVVGARVVLTVPPCANRETLVRTFWTDGAADVVVCTAAGVQVERTPHSAASTLTFGALVGQDDGCLWPMITAVRAAAVVKLPRGYPRFAPLLLEDAARAALLVGQGVTRTLPGPDTMTLEALAQAVIDRFGGRYAWRWWSGDVRYAAAWEGLGDEWEPAWGPRTTIPTWIDRLPGLRVRPREDRGRSH